MFRKSRLASASAVSRISRSPGRNTRTSPGRPRAAARRRRRRWRRSGRGRGRRRGRRGRRPAGSAPRRGSVRPDTSTIGTGVPRASAKCSGEPLGVDRRRGDDDLEVRAAREQLREVAEDEVDVEAALVGLVDDQRVVAAEHPVAGQLGEQDAVGHQLDQRVLADLVGEADLPADNGRRPARCPAPRRCGRRPCARRAGAAGCGRSCRATPRPSSRQIFGIWVVFPEPVSPATITTWWSRIAAAMSSRRALTGSAAG